MARFVHILAAALVAMVSRPLVCPARAAPVPEGSRFALVIGNSNYSGVTPLPACTASANVVSAALKRAGFGVTEQLDQTIGQMDADLAALAKAVNDKPASSAVIYICGYAAGFNNRTFLLPVSVTIERDTDVLTQGLVAKSVPDTIRRSPAAGGLVLIDAVAWPNASGKLALDTLINAPPEGRVGMAAASTATVPPQGATPLAASLAAVMRGPDIEAGAVLAALRRDLSGAPLAVRAPAETAWLAGGPAPPPPAPPAAAPQPVAAPVPAPSMPPPPAVQPVTFPAEEYMTADDRQRIQTALLRLGYYDGKVDGIFGPDTRAAIRRFQHEIGTEMTGRITPEQASRLVTEGH
jgi:hypothetical protein